MREFNTRIVEALQKGLRPSEFSSRGRPFLKEAYNVKVTEFGLEPFHPIQDPFGGAYSVNFPFPQLFVGEDETLLSDKRYIFEVDMMSNPWEASRIDVYDGRKENALGHIPEGGQWHMADLKDAWYLFNGECVVFKTRHNELAGGDQRVLVIDDVSINTGTEYKGRVITGGFDPSNIWGSSWKHFFDSWEASLDMDLPFEFDDIGSNYVMWSSIGGGDFPLWLFYPELAMEGFIPDAGYYTDDIKGSMLLERLQKNEWGFMPMPWQGEILNIEPLGEALIVYGDEAITAMIPAQFGFGYQHLMNVGIADRGAVAGNRGGHIFIGESGELWSIGPQLQTNKIGYKEYFLPMLGTDISISLNHQESEFYIANKDRCFLLDQGLTEIKQIPTSVEFQQGGLIGVYDEKTFTSGKRKGMVDDRTIIVTNPISFSVSALKTTTVISLGVRSPHKVEVALEYTTKKSDNWKRTRFVPVNKEGNADLRVNGLDFRVVIKAEHYDNFELDFVEVRFQPDDRRFVRGTSVNTSNS